MPGTMGNFPRPAVKFRVDALDTVGGVGPDARQHDGNETPIEDARSLACDRMLCSQMGAMASTTTADFRDPAPKTPRTSF
jgi:hypothetical protein